MASSLTTSTISTGDDDDAPGVARATLRGDLRRARELLRVERAHYALGLGSLLLLNVCDVLAPLFLAVAIDLTHATLSGTAPRTPPLLQLFGLDSAMFSILAAAAVFLALHAAANALRYPMLMHTAVPSHRIGQRLRNALVDKLLRLPQPWYDRATSGDVMARGTSDILAARMMMGPGVLVGADALLLLTLVFATMLTLSPWLSLVVLAPLPVIGWVTHRLSRAEYGRYEAVQQDLARLTERTRESYAGIRILQGYARESFERERFRRESSAHCGLNLRLARVRSLFDPTLDLLLGASTVLVLIFGGLQVVDGSLSLGTFVAFLFLVGYLSGPMIGLGWSLSLIQRGRASLRRIDALLDEPVTITDPEQARAPRGLGEIAVRDLTFAYSEEGGPVLQDITFTLPPGRTLGIIGAVGSGKTTLVRLLSRLYDPPPGTVRLDGVDLRELALDDLRRQIVVAPQETFLFSDTVARNILLAVDQPADADATHFARLAQLHDEIVDLKEGYDTMLGERGVNLSGGQRQRLAIARAIAANPRVLVLDDCLSAVDARTEEAILGALRQIFAGRSGIIVSHRVCAVRDCDEILVLDQGRIAERGVHAELVARDGLYAAIAREQAAPVAEPKPTAAAATEPAA